MSAATAQSSSPLLRWIQHAERAAPSRRSPRRGSAACGGVRFAFYGRISTEDFQDKLSSACWQRDFAEDLVAGHGVIVADFFDVGYSRRREWPDRPRAAALLAAVADPHRDFDAIVVGEFERAFYGDQLTRLAPLLRQHGVQLWLPELDGPADFDQPMHQALLRLLGVHSKREVLRSRYRALAAMRAQVTQQGRHLGGRPPYGYQLVDAGPHPNRAHARWGRRLHRLEPDPATAPHVRWMFTQRLAGASVASIARTLNGRGVPCPSSVDPVRNPHRTGAGWTLRTVAAILANPRYTGRQVWNRQRSDHDPSQHGDDLLGQIEVRRWNTTGHWVISTQQAHPALVSEDEFVAAQHISARPAPDDGTSRTYLLSGLLRCHLCGRILDSHWVHGRPGYRCRHGHTSATMDNPDRPKTLYLREDLLLTRIAAELGLLDHRPRQIAAHLHAKDITVTCGPATIVLDEGRSIAAPRAAGSIPHQRRRSPTEIHQQT